MRARGSEIEPEYVRSNILRDLAGHAQRLSGKSIIFSSQRFNAHQDVADTTCIDQRVAKIETTLQQLANVLVLTARQDERLIAIERRVDRLDIADRDSRGLLDQPSLQI